jgi:hypothetical protein
MRMALPKITKIKRLMPSDDCTNVLKRGRIAARQSRRNASVQGSVTLSVAVLVASRLANPGIGTSRVVVSGCAEFQTRK